MGGRKKGGRGLTWWGINCNEHLGEELKLMPRTGDTRTANPMNRITNNNYMVELYRYNIMAWWLITNDKKKKIPRYGLAKPDQIRKQMKCMMGDNFSSNLLTCTSS